MIRRKIPLFLLLAAIILTAFAAQSRSRAAGFVEADDAPLLELVGMATVDSAPNSMIVRCEGFQCSRYHELVYWGYDNKIYFLDANTLGNKANPLATSDGISAIRDERYLFYDRMFHQVYALDKYDMGSYPNQWYRLAAGIIRGYDFAGSVKINEDYNDPTPVDIYYPIDGAALLQPNISAGSVAKIYVDNPVNGNVDVVTFHGHDFDNPALLRFSYRTPLGCASDPSYCSWNSNAGSSIAVDATGSSFIADNNDLMDRIVVRNPNGTAGNNFDQVGNLFYCYVDEAGIHTAPDEDILYLPQGCQSFADGALAQLDLTTPRDHNVIDIPYYDQRMVVDWFDQKRVFIATTDFDGLYDPGKHLYLHLIYDGQLLASLPVMADYERRSLTAMAFNPYTNILYLAVEGTIYKVKVNYGGTAGFPDLPEGQKIITPEADHDLVATDSSAIFHFSAGSVDDDALVTYQELPPKDPPGGTLSAFTSNGTGSYSMRQFELTAVYSDTQAPITSFNSNYQLELSYSPQEIAPIIGGGGAVQLYRWDGGAWQQVGDTYTGGENKLTIYSDLTGRFAIMGPTNPVFLPAVLK